MSAQGEQRGGKKNEAPEHPYVTQQPGLRCPGRRVTDRLALGAWLFDGSISMTCYAMSVDLSVETGAGNAATLPRNFPADQTNM